MTTHMPMWMMTGWSEDPDLVTAGRGAATRAQVILGGTPDGALIPYRVD